MNKFWNWMEKNYYSCGNKDISGIEPFPTQMIIGYKIEFLTKLKGKFNIGSVFSIDELDEELDNLIKQFVDKR